MEKKKILEKNQLLIFIISWSETYRFSGGPFHNLFYKLKCFEKFIIRSQKIKIEDEGSARIKVNKGN